MNDVVYDIEKTIPYTESIIVATSGGPDSMALIYLLKKINKYRIICAHVNHKLRSESEKEAQMVKSFCEKNNIIFEYTELKNYNGNTENFAREERYKFFEKLIKKYDSKYLLTAHHGDDLLETILMRFSRFSSISGLIGFKKISTRKNYFIYRPLITQTKEAILKYCKENSVKYAIDKTNFDDKYTRNRFRKYIIPSLKEENNLIHSIFLKFSTELNEYEEYINKQAKNIMPNVYIDDKLLVSSFNKLDNIIKKKILYIILKYTYKDSIRYVKERHIKDIIKILNSEKPNLKLNLPKNKLFIKEYNKAYICENIIIKSYDYKFEQVILLPNNHKIVQLKNTKEMSNNILKLNSKEISMPLHVRTRKKGDKIILKGLEKEKKIKDIFINEKVPINERELYPIVTDSTDEVIWIPGLKKSKFDKSKTENYDIIIKYF